MRVHGSDTSDMVIAIDGMRVNNLCGSGQFSGFYMNDASVQEVTYTTGAESAEMQAGGLRINSVPKDGGNTFSGTFFASRPGQLAAGRQPVRRRQAVHPGRRDRIRLSNQPLVRRSAEEGQALVLLHLQVRGQQDLRPQLDVRRRQPGVPELDGQLQRGRQADVGGLEPRQDPSLRREAVQRRVLQRLQHARHDLAGGVHRCLRQRLGAADQVDARAIEQAAARGRHLVLQPAVRAELHARRSGLSISPAWNRRRTG